MRGVNRISMRGTESPRRGGRRGRVGNVGVSPVILWCGVRCTMRSSNGRSQAMDGSSPPRVSDGPPRTLIDGARDSERYEALGGSRRRGAGSLVDPGGCVKAILY